MIKSVREGKERSSWSYPNADYEAGLAALCARRARRRPAQPVPRRFRRLRRHAGAAGRDRLVGAAGAEADRAGRAGHLPGRRTVGFQPGRSRQPPAGRLDASAGNCSTRWRRRAADLAAPGRTGAKSCSSLPACWLAAPASGAVRVGLRAASPEQRAEAMVATRAVVSLDDRRYVLDGPRATIGRSKEAECVLARPQRLPPPRRAAPRARPATGRSSTSARPTGSRSTAAASPRLRLSPGDQVTVGTTTFLFDIEQ